jgi:hypothetical protein
MFGDFFVKFDSEEFWNRTVEMLLYKKLEFILMLEKQNLSH